jgi:hypothetical protein
MKISSRIPSFTDAFENIENNNRRSCRHERRIKNKIKATDRWELKISDKPMQGVKQVYMRVSQSKQ